MGNSPGDENRVGQPADSQRTIKIGRVDQTFHHSVYVILLDNAVAKHRSILHVNPKRDPLKPCVYIGMTGLPVDHRFENHKNGYKSAWVVKKYGVRLMPELYEHLKSNAVCGSGPDGDRTG